jgi:hypothetical protein
VYRVHERARRAEDPSLFLYLNMVLLVRKEIDERLQLRMYGRPGLIHCFVLYCLHYTGSTSEEVFVVFLIFLHFHRKIHYIQSYLCQTRSDRNSICCADLEEDQINFRHPIPKCKFLLFSLKNQISF